MGTPLEFAQNDLRSSKNIYLDSLDSYDRVRARADILAKTTADEFNAVPALSESYVGDYEAPADTFTTVLIAVLQEFSQVARSEESDAASLVVDLDTYMREQTPRDAIKSRGSIVDSPVDGGANTGDQTLIINSKNPDGTVNEAANIDNVRFDLNLRGASLSLLGQDLWDVRGTARSTFSEFDGPGSGVENSQMTALGPGRTNFFTNPSFDQSLRTGGAGPDKVVGVKITSGDANVSLTRTDVAQNRGGNPGALEITGPCTLEIDFLSLGISLSEVRPFVMGLRAETTGNAAFTMTLGSTGAATPYTGTINIVGAQAWQNYLVDADTETAWRETFDETGRPILVINVTAVSAILRLDDLVLDTLPIVGGVPTAIVSGLIAPGSKDFHLSNRRLTSGSGTITLTGGAAGDFVEQVTIDGVTLLREPMEAEATATATAEKLVSRINSVPTAPDYEASNVANVITVTQRKPKAGTLTLVTTIDDNGGGLAAVDVNVTGGDIGEIADMLARHIGFVPSHDASATSGWQD